MKLSQSVREIYRPGAAAAAAPLNTAEQALHWFIYFFWSWREEKKKKKQLTRGNMASSRLAVCR